METKLWRNPEARREVVGQIVDYAKELSTWDVEKLVASLAEADETKVGSTTKELYEYVRTKSEDLQEQEFLDSLAVSLREGRVLLLIAGDGVRENVESIAEFLDRFPQLHFKLALVELLLYELKSDLLVVPQVLTRTREIERAVVRDKPRRGRTSGWTFPPKDLRENAGERSRRLTSSANWHARAVRTPSPWSRTFLGSWARSALSRTMVRFHSPPAFHIRLVAGVWVYFWCGQTQRSRPRST